MTKAFVIVNTYGGTVESVEVYLDEKKANEAYIDAIDDIMINEDQYELDATDEKKIEIYRNLASEFDNGVVLFETEIK